MKFNDLSITFHTHEIAACKEFYEKYFKAKITFDYSWYATIQLDADKPYKRRHLFLSFMEPQDNSTNVSKGGITLNLKVADVNAEYEAIKKTNLVVTNDIEDHDWGDRSFTVTDPIGNILYIYSEREMTKQYKDAVKQ